MKTGVILFLLYALLQVEMHSVAARTIRETPVSPPEEETSVEAESDILSEGEVLNLTAEDEACLDELHLDRELILELASEDLFPDDNDDFNKFVGCSWQKAELQDSNGSIDYDKLTTTLTEMAVNEFKSMVKKNMASAVKYCKNNPPLMGETHGQTAVRIQNCIALKLNEMFYE